MKIAKLYVLQFFVFASFLTACGFFDKKKEDNFWENPVYIDLDGIQERGVLRAVIDNSSTSFYIYRGRRMGYEYELLMDLANQLGVHLDLVISSDIMETFRFLNQGKADIIAINLEVTEERQKYAQFTDPIGKLSTVLVQRVRDSLVTDRSQLHQKVIHLKSGTIYKNQLQAIKDSLQIDLDFVEWNESLENLIDKVVEGEIDFTVVDKDIALVNATYYEDVNVNMEINEASDVSWAVRRNSPLLLESVNNWIERSKSSSYLAILYDKYFLNKKNSYFRSTSAFSSVSGGMISVFDDLIKEGADELGWDWRLLASLVFKESRFDTTAISYAGAVGLFQLMPVTLARFGVTDPNDPQQSLMGGVNYLKYLDKFWLERVPNPNERIKFILASYNVGHGHVEDAWRLAFKFGKDTQIWDNIAYYLQRKSQSEFYRDPVVKSGYAKGHVTVSYVRDLWSLYESYRVLVEP